MIQSIGLVIRPDNDSATQTAKRVIQHASKLQLNWVVSGREGVPEGFEPHKTVHLAELSNHCDLVMVIGGDGSLLGAARALAKADTPVLGVNRGSLGFLTDISPDDACQAIDLALQGQCGVDRRHLIGVSVERDGEIIAAGSALNDIVLHKGNSARMLSFNVSVDGRTVYDARADGLIVATPTGSTAYSLSAGGPILHPSLGAWVIVPMFPHTMADRPLVLNDDAIICLSITDKHQSLPLISCDGQTHISVMPGDKIEIRKLPEQLHLLHPGDDYDYYAVCRQKLGWASRLGD